MKKNNKKKLNNTKIIKNKPKTTNPFDLQKRKIKTIKIIKN